MDLVILSISDAIKYVPNNNTYAIRIHGFHLSTHWTREFNLVSSPNYVHAASYIFDDIDLAYNPYGDKGLLFDEGIAKKILDDFKEKGLACDTLMVHCTKGQNRSPAVAIALNEIFGLGNDSVMLKDKYDGLTRHVYDVLIRTAKNIHFSIKKD